MNNTRTERIGESIKREVSQILQNEIKDPRLPSMLSITRCELSRDGHFAKIFVSLLGDEDQRKEAQKALKNASGYIRTLLSKRLSLRQVPQFVFVMDDSIEYSVHIASLMDQIRPEGGYKDDTGGEDKQHDAAQTED